MDNRIALNTVINVDDLITFTKNDKEFIITCLETGSYTAFTLANAKAILASLTALLNDTPAV